MPTYEEYKAMGRVKLRQVVMKMLAQQERIKNLFNNYTRDKLVVAGQALHDIVAQPGKRVHDPDNPNWKAECDALGITPNRFRQWKHRTQSETDLIRLAGEAPKLHPKAKLDANVQDQLATAKRLLKELSEAVIYGREDVAERVAQAAVDHFRF